MASHVYKVTKTVTSCQPFGVSQIRASPTTVKFFLEFHRKQLGCIKLYAFHVNAVITWCTVVISVQFQFCKVKVM